MRFSRCHALFFAGALRLFVFEHVIAQQIVRVDSIFAPSVGVVKRFTVILPKDTTPQNPYPVLFLLHGYGGDNTNWTSRTRLVEYLHDLPMVVILPDAGNSWYANSATNPDQRYEDYMMSDLRRFVAHRYPVDTTRAAIAGLSMGGYGAIMLALRHPDAFLFAGSLSGALTFPRFLEDTLFQPLSFHLHQNALEVFGASGNPSRLRYDPFLLLANYPKTSRTFFYLAAGTNDGFRGFLPAHRMFTDSLRASSIAYEYHEAPGGHGWEFWDKEIQPLLRVLRERMNF